MFNSENCGPIILDLSNLATQIEYYRATVSLLNIIKLLLKLSNFVHFLSLSMQKLLKLSSRSIATTTEYAFPTQIEQILFSVCPVRWGQRRQWVFIPSHSTPKPSWNVQL